MAQAAPVDVDDALLASWPLPGPGAGGDKEQRGQVLVIAGSREMPGAAWLSAIGALRAGAGKLAVATAGSVACGLALQLPEARVVALPEAADGGLLKRGVETLEDVLRTADAVLVGPGLVDEAASIEFVHAVLEQRVHAQFVLDALALGIAREAGRFVRPPLLTPHAGEMARLTGLSKDEVLRDAERVAVDAAARWNAVVALKGPVTWVAAPDGRRWRHEGGNVGLGTSGSGDVLAGIVAGLAARGAPLEQAAVWGVALHARAGDALARRHGLLGYLARELLEEVPRLMHALAPIDGETQPWPTT